MLEGHIFYHYVYNFTKKKSAKDVFSNIPNLCHRILTFFRSNSRPKNILLIQILMFGINKCLPSQTSNTTNTNTNTNGPPCNTHQELTVWQGYGTGVEAGELVLDNEKGGWSNSSNSVGVIPSLIPNNQPIYCYEFRQHFESAKNKWF